MSDWMAWSNGQWMPNGQVGLGINDWGFLQGVVLVERLRTVNGQLLDWEAHFQRFQAGCGAFNISLPSSESLQQTANECVERNLRNASEMSVVILATPGVTSQAGSPTLIVHAQSLPWRKLHRVFAEGERLVVSESRNVPAACWSPQIKTRARLQYYAADQNALRESPPDVPASGLLLDTQGAVTETSSANVIAVVEGRLKCPLLEGILQGISLRRTLRLAEELDLPVDYQRLTPEDLFQADELLLTGTSGCLWYASSLKYGDQERVFHADATDGLFNKLARAWKKDIGLDYLAQAKERA